MSEHNPAGTDPVQSVLRVNGIAMNVAQAGPESGTPVLLLHGFPESWWSWRHQIDALATAGYRVIAPDLRGFGETEKPADPAAYRIGILVDDVLGLLDALGLERAAVVSHDWGAALAWRLAMVAPRRLTSLVVVSTGHPGANTAAGLSQRQKSWYMLWFLFDGVAEKALPADDWALYRDWVFDGAKPGTDPDLDRHVADLSRPGALTAGLNWYRANIRPESFVRNLAALAAPPVPMPVMGVWSDQDPALGREQMVGSGEFVSGPWRYEQIDGVDHWVPAHAPDRLNELLLDWLGQHGRG
jgi:pimeloyl-ACP methyl ester carboxylesterase